MSFVFRKKDPKEDRQPKIVENPKTSLHIYGGKTSEVVRDVLSDFQMLRKPHCKKFTKKNQLLPFEDVTSLEFFSEKNDASLFAFGNHQKKRPHNIIMGRMFNYKLLDMAEFGIENYKAMSKSCSMSFMSGSKPCLLFQGSHFENNETMSKIKNLFIDFFRGEVVKKINILGLDHVIVFTSLSDSKIHFGHYSLKYEKSGKDVPKIDLIEIGPFMNFNLRRVRFASDDLRKEALRVPELLKPSLQRNKNITLTATGDREGRIHVQQQDISSISTRKFKAFKNRDEELDDDLDVDAIKRRISQSNTESTNNSMEIDTANE